MDQLILLTIENSKIIESTIYYRKDASLAELHSVAEAFANYMWGTKNWAWKPTESLPGRYLCGPDGDCIEIH